MQFKMTVKQSKKILEQEMTIVLAFFYKLLFNTPFKRDHFYDNENLTYEARKLFNKNSRYGCAWNFFTDYIEKKRNLEKITTKNYFY